MAAVPSSEREWIEGVVAEISEVRARLSLEALDERRLALGIVAREIERLKRGRRPGESGMPAMAEPPRGPLPMLGGAEAPID